MFLDAWYMLEPDARTPADLKFLDLDFCIRLKPICCSSAAV